MKCPKCGFEAPIWEWRLVEKSGISRLPDEAIKSYEEAVDKISPYPEAGKQLAKIVFRALTEHGLMPYHTTEFICPKCGYDLNALEGEG